MVTENTVNGVKWTVFTFAAAAVIAGVILQCYGLARVFQVDPTVAGREGVSSRDALGPYLNCDQAALMRSGGPAAASNVTANNATSAHLSPLDRLYSEQCKARQSPYMYLWAVTASLSFFMLPILIWALHKETRGPILLSAIWLAITIAMLFLCLYAYMQAVERNKYHMIACSKLNPDEAHAIQSQKLGICVDNSSAVDNWNRARRCLLAGIILNVIALSFLSWLLPWIFHLSKVRVVLPGATKDDFGQRQIRGPSETVQAAPMAPTYTTTQPTGPSYV